MRQAVEGAIESPSTDAIQALCRPVDSFVEGWHRPDAPLGSGPAPPGVGEEDPFVGRDHDTTKGTNTERTGAAELDDSQQCRERGLRRVT